MNNWSYALAALAARAASWLRKRSKRSTCVQYIVHWAPYCLFLGTCIPHQLQYIALLAALASTSFIGAPAYLDGCWLRLLRLLHQLRWLRLLRHLRSIYCSFGFWGPILPIVLRIGALDALAAFAAQPPALLHCATCVQYIAYCL